ncbi:MAG: sensor histidine kinase [Alphaproteobacteria bacterium]
MATRVVLSGTDWDELLARHRKNVETLRKANRLASGDAQAGIRELLGEVSRLIEGCRQFERKSRDFEAAMAGLGTASENLEAEVRSLPEGFLATVSPKLLSPFTSICSFSEILSDYPELPLDQRNSFLDIVIKESGRLTRMIEQVVAFARMRAGRMDWHVVDVDLCEAVADATAATEPLFRDKVVALDIALAERLPPVRADGDWLVEVLRNLLTNAAKFSEAGKGQVAVAAAPAGRMVEVNVSDDGPGIAPERRSIVFAQYLECDDTLSDEPQGAGLGLALSKQAVEHFGGRIWVDSAAGGGARFAFTLPAGGARI